MIGSSRHVAIVGGGIVGLATALALVGRRRPAEVVVLEAEARLATHQTGHNSGVIHSGLYYRPGSLKARNCAEGREALVRFCQEHDVPFERCGKLVIATDEGERAALAELERRGRANGLRDLRRLAAGEISELEPHAAGVEALFVGETGIVDFSLVARRFAERVTGAGGLIRTGARLLRMVRNGRELLLETTAGEVRAGVLVNCAGLHSDRVARRCGLEPGLRIVPFRGEYFELTPERRMLVRNLIYPVPDPRFPFLGAHFTRRIDGGVEAGPNAVLAFAREGYRRSAFSPRDVLELVSYAGFWRMAARYWKTAIGEIHRSVSTRAFVTELRRLVPQITIQDVRRAGSGVRAQAVEPSGLLVDDFRILEGERMVHVLNAPSPAATASISIGQAIAAKVEAHLGSEA